VVDENSVEKGVEIVGMGEFFGRASLGFIVLGKFLTSLKQVLMIVELNNFTLFQVKSGLKVHNSRRLDKTINTIKVKRVGDLFGFIKLGGDGDLGVLAFEVEHGEVALEGDVNAVVDQDVQVLGFGDEFAAAVVDVVEFGVDFELRFAQVVLGERLPQPDQNKPVSCY
jgi:hypothetical protein